MTAPLLMMAAGGTGGHMFPAQALAETMLGRGWRVKLSTDARGARYTDGFPGGTEISQVASATFARGGLAAKALVAPRIAAGMASAMGQMRRDRPAVVVGFGGYPSIPALGAAVVLGVPRLIHEQNGVLGRVNRLFAPRVAHVACGVWPTDLPHGASGLHIGNPVRAAVAAQSGAPYVPPVGGPLSVLVIGGSQGARILSDVVPQALADLPFDLRTRLTVSHQARSEDAARVTAFYTQAGIAADVEPFFADVPARMAAAQLVISRAGASTIADLTVIGRPAILVPYAAAAGDHQTANARGLVAGGAAILMPETALDAAALCAQMTRVLSDASVATAMAAAARTAGAPDAVDRLAALVTTLAGKDPA